MVTLEVELQSIRENLIEMMDLTLSQLIKCEEAFLPGNPSIAKIVKDVMTLEKRINAFEISINKDCENVLALHTPVATDLRFVLAVLKITGNLERIGDNVKGISKLVDRDIKKYNMVFIEKFGLGEMFNIAISMLKKGKKAFEDNNTTLARKIFKRDKHLNKKNKNRLKTSGILIENHPKRATLIIRFLSIVGKLERVGDLSVHIAEEVIFHVEATPAPSA